MGRYSIDWNHFQNYHRLVWGRGKKPTLSIIDRTLSIGLEIEKLLIFVHQMMGHDLKYLKSLNAVTFFQLLREADKIHKAREKAT